MNDTKVYKSTIEEKKEMLAKLKAARPEIKVGFLKRFNERAIAEYERAIAAETEQTNAI